MDVGALAAAGVALFVGLLSFSQNRASNRRDDFTVIAARLDRELATERLQRRLLSSYVMDLLRWGRRIAPPDDPVPDPPDDLDLSPWA
ncbi:hypothetical protein [Streptomyces sp. NPDC053560]|uniref:hypothetical protein n=1 Tax=Streptomyces sp. NPDC053560 TaxID=3365711 RepID=UPI0037D928CE